MLKYLFVRKKPGIDKLEYLPGPAKFRESAKEFDSYKNYLIAANTDQAFPHPFFVYGMGFEVAERDKCLVNRVFNDHFIIHYIIGGKGLYNNRPIGRGDCVLSFRKKIHSLITDPDDPLVFYWVMLKHSSDFSPGFFGFYENNMIFKYSFENEMKQILNSMLNVDIKTNNLEYYFFGKFYQLMALHTGGYPKEDAESRTPYSKYIMLALNIMEEKEYSLSVEKIAQTLGFSRKHFSKIFFMQTGKSPQEHIVENKTKIAKIMLKSGDYTVKQVAHQLGYSDYSSFSRTFKKHTGVSPAEFAASLGNQKP